MTFCDPFFLFCFSTVNALKLILECSNDNFDDDFYLHANDNKLDDKNKLPFVLHIPYIARKFSKLWKKRKQLIYLNFLNNKLEKMHHNNTLMMMMRNAFFNDFCELLFLKWKFKCDDFFYVISYAILRLLYYLTPTMWWILLLFPN